MKPIIMRLAVIGLPVLAAIALAAPGTAVAAPAGVQSTGSGAVALAAAADVVPAAASDCPPKYLCFWVNAGYSGVMGKVEGNNGSWTKFAQSACATKTWNDCASSLYNHGQSENARVFKDNNGGGGGACLPRNMGWSNLTSKFFDSGVNMNDQISSNDWVTAACS